MKTLEEIERLALAATPIWKEFKRTSDEYEIRNDWGGTLFRSTSYGQMPAAAAFIGALNPGTAIRLIHALRIAMEALRWISEPEHPPESPGYSFMLSMYEGTARYALAAIKKELGE